MTDRPSPIKPPLEAGPARRVLHTLMSLAGWALFIYWWWLVFHRVSGREIRFTAWFIALSLVGIVLVTMVWAWHNVRIFRRKGARAQVREAHSDFARDGIGRPVEFPATGLDRRTAPVIHVRWTETGKRYDVAAALPPRPPAAPAPDGTSSRS